MLSTSLLCFKVFPYYSLFCGHTDLFSVLGKRHAFSVTGPCTHCSPCCPPPLLHKSYFFFRSELKCHFPREDVPRLLSFTSVALPENPLHTNFRVGNSQRCELGFTCPVMLDVSEIVPRPPSPIADNPSALPSPTSSLSSSQ